MDSNKKFPNIWGAVFLLALLFGLQIIIGLFVYEFGFNFEDGDPRALGIITILSYGIFFPLVMGYKKLGYRELFNPSPNSFTSMIVLLSIPIALTVFGSVFWVSDLTNLMLQYFPANEDEYTALNNMASNGIVSVITICAIAPIGEEMLFRGIILRSFLNNYTTATSMLLSSALFAAYHMTITQLPVAFILGYFSAWIYVKTKSLWPSIMAHFLYNSFSMIVWSTYYSSDTFTDDIDGYNSPGVMIASLAASMLGLLLLYYLLRPKTETRS